MKIKQLLFTHCATGNGFDPEKSSGYQIKAMSDNLDNLPLLSEWSAQLGQTVYSYSPEIARKNEAEWLKTTENVADGVPEAVLSNFPVIWTYRKLGPELYSLTRTSYIGLTRDRRSAPGNFLTNTLVFPSSILGSPPGNPLGLISAVAFQIDPDTIEAGPLPTLETFGADIENECDTKILGQSDFEAQLPALLSAVFMSRDRPLVICLRDASEAVPLLAALLQVLPPGLRCTTTFTTHSHDPCWPGTDSNDPNPARIPNQITIISTHGSDSKGPQPDEPRLRHLQVFNFVSGRFPEASPVSAFGRFAADCIQRNNPKPLESYHRVAFALGCDGTVTDCDRLVSIFTPSSTSGVIERLIERLQILVPLVRTKAGAECAFQLVEAKLKSLGEAGFDEAEIPLAQLLSSIWSAPEPSKENSLPGGITRMIAYINEQLTAGNVQRASCLLEGCGNWEGHALSATLDNLCACADTLNVANAQEVNALAARLRRLYSANAERQIGPQLLCTLIRLIGRLEHQHGNSLWKSIQPEIAKSFTGELTTDKLRLIDDLCNLTETFPQPAATLLFNRLAMTQLSPNDSNVTVLLRRMAQACSTCENPQTESDAVIALIYDKYPNPLTTAFLLGIVADTAFGSTAGDLFISAFRGAEDQLPNRNNQLNEELTKAGCFTLLSWEFLDRLPLNSIEAAEMQIDSWLQQPEFAESDMGDKLCAVLAAAVKEPNLELSRVLFNRQLQLEPTGSGFVALFSRIAKTFPLGQIPPEWDEILSTPPGGMNQMAMERLRVSKFLGRLSNEASQGLWSFANFDPQDADWQAYHRLENSSREEILRFLMSLLKLAGLYHGRDALAFIQVMTGLYSWQPEDLAGQLLIHLERHEIVTQIMTLTALAHCAVIDSEYEELCSGTARILLNKLATGNKDLPAGLSAHIASRFNDSRIANLTQISKICESAGMVKTQSSGGVEVRHSEDKTRKPSWPFGKKT